MWRSKAIGMAGRMLPSSIGRTPPSQGGKVGSTPIGSTNLGPLVYEVGSLVFTQKNGVRLPGGLPSLRSSTAEDPVFTRGMEVRILPEAPETFGRVGQWQTTSLLTRGWEFDSPRAHQSLSPCGGTADAADSKPVAERRGGSTPLGATTGLWWNSRHARFRIWCRKA